MLIERDPMEILNLLKEPSKNKHGRPLNRFPSHSGFSIWNKPAKTIFSKIPRLLHPPISLMFGIETSIYILRGVSWQCPKCFLSCSHHFPMIFPWSPVDFRLEEETQCTSKNGTPVIKPTGVMRWAGKSWHIYIYMVYLYRNHEINRFPHGQHPCMYIYIYGLEISRDIDI